MLKIYKSCGNSIEKMNLKRKLKKIPKELIIGGIILIVGLTFVHVKLRIAYLIFSIIVALIVMIIGHRTIRRK